MTNDMKIAAEMTRKSSALLDGIARRIFLNGNSLCNWTTIVVDPSSDAYEYFQVDNEDIVRRDDGTIVLTIATDDAVTIMRKMEMDDDGEELLANQDPLTMSVILLAEKNVVAFAATRISLNSLSSLPS